MKVLVRLVTAHIPKIGAQTTVQAIIAAKYNYLRFGVTGPYD